MSSINSFFLTTDPLDDFLAQLVAQNNTLRAGVRYIRT